jgi:hypothetical protein
MPKAIKWSMSHGMMKSLGKIQTYDFATKKSTVVTKDPAIYRTPSFSPDGNTKLSIEKKVVMVIRVTNTILIRGLYIADVKRENADISSR